MTPNSARTLEVQGTVLADQSNATAAVVRKAVDDLSSENRQQLQAVLDSAVQETADESARADVAAGSTPLGSVATAFTAVFAERARSMTQLRAAVDGFLGVQPVRPAGAPAGGTPAGASNNAALLSATQATNRITGAGALLAHSDALYRTVRRSLLNAAGHGKMPASVWVTRPQLWQPGSVAAQVDLLATSSTLAATHYVVIRTVRLDPPPLPTPQGTPSGISVLNPTTRIAVSVVLANQGSSDEPHVAVRYSLADATSGATLTQTQSVALSLGGSVTLPSVTMRVTPSTTYVLTVQVIPPAGQTITNGTEAQEQLQVAPAT